jgi:hypothetical protein
VAIVSRTAGAKQNMFEVASVTVQTRWRMPDFGNR